MTPNYLSHLAEESDRFEHALRAVAPDARVPTCPDWTAADLLWHLGEVQWFWATIVTERVDGATARDRKPGRPTEVDQVRAFFAEATGMLRSALATGSDTDPAWTWAPSPEDHTVGFIRRRQAHEALIHRVDAELTAGRTPAPLERDLAADGVDEALRVMYAGVPPWGTFTPDPDGAAVRVRATDADRSWLVRLGRFTGTDPEGTAHDEPDIAIAPVDDGAPTNGQLSGTAADLDRWLWHRPTEGAVELTGGPDVTDHLRTVLGQPIN